jgi:hypothetical protein
MGTLESMVALVKMARNKVQVPNQASNSRSDLWVRACVMSQCLTRVLESVEEQERCGIVTGICVERTSIPVRLDDKENLESVEEEEGILPEPPEVGDVCFRRDFDAFWDMRVGVSDSEVWCEMAALAGHVKRSRVEALGCMSSGLILTRSIQLSKV